MTSTSLWRALGPPSNGHGLAWSGDADRAHSVVRYRQVIRRASYCSTPADLIGVPCEAERFMV